MFLVSVQNSLEIQIDDKNKELQIQEERIRNLESLLEKRNADHSEMEKKLRKELDISQSRNSELETKLVEAASIVSIKVNLYCQCLLNELSSWEVKMR